MKFKNLPCHAIKLEKLIDIEANQVVSSSLLDSDEINISIFSFADLEQINEESYTGETLYYIISGSVIIRQDNKEHKLEHGDVLKIEENTLHEIEAVNPFKMIQITLKEKGE